MRTRRDGSTRLTTDVIDWPVNGSMTMFVRLPTQIDETGLILAAFAENERNMDVLRIEYYNREVILFHILYFIFLINIV